MSDQDVIDSLRPKGSFESARTALNGVARSTAERIGAAIPGQPWKVNADSELGRMSYLGAPCDELPGDVALRPAAEPIVFDPAFTADNFPVAVDVIREQAAKLGATQESSLFNDGSKREYQVSGNGYEFRVMQMEVAVFTVSGDCHLLQKVIDLPPEQSR